MNKRVRIDGEMMVAIEYRSSWRKASPSSSLCTINPIWTGLKLNPGIDGERPFNKLPEPRQGVLNPTIIFFLKGTFHSMSRGFAKF